MTSRTTRRVGACIFAFTIVGLSAEAMWPRAIQTQQGPGVGGSLLPLVAAVEAEPTLPPHEYRIHVVTREAKRAGVPVPMAIAVSVTENWGGDTLAVSRAGAVGIMQVMPTVWGREFADECGSAPLTNPHRNACVGVRILKRYHQRYGNWNLALRAYNGSLRYGRSGDRYVAQVMERLRFVE